MTFAALLAGMPDLLERALSEHVPDRNGHCRECGGAARWPCAMRMLADEADRMSGAPNGPG